MSGCWVAMKLPPNLSGGSVCVQDLTGWGKEAGLAAAVRFGKVIGGGQEPTGRGFIGGSDQHANAIYLHLRVLSSGIICRHSCLQAVTAQYAGEQFRLGAATNDGHTHRRAVHDLNSSVRTRICHKAAPGRYWVGGERASPCGVAMLSGPGRGDGDSGGSVACPTNSSAAPGYDTCVG
jgi:hypothetical protein